MSVRIMKLSEVPGVDVDEEGFSGVNSVWAVLKREDVVGFSSRIFRMEPGGHTAMHSHDREHVAVVIRGGCRVEAGQEMWEAGEGSVIAIPSGVPHKFSNVNPERIVLLIMNLFAERDGAEPQADEK